MPYATQRDRTPAELELVQTPWPAPPLNVFMKSGFHPGVFDLMWDDPSQLALNSRFSLLGVNVYRAFDSEFGPFERITDFPIGSTYWRDQTNNVLILEEDVSQNWVLFGVVSASGMDAPRYVFRTNLKPIVKESSQQVFANSPFDVQVFVDGMQVPVLAVYGQTGEIEIDVRRYPDPGKQTYLPTVVPTPTSKVTCTYRYTKSIVKTNLVERIYYRFTTVGIPYNVPVSTCNPGDLLETPLEAATSTSSYEIEKLDYMWKEAVRRNHWILQEGGERVKLFLRKRVGIICPCIPDEHHGQPLNDDPLCFGTGIVGGYEGPYEMIIAPDDSEKKISQKEQGRTVEHTYESWTGPSPLLSHRDFLVKINGERYTVGAVRMPTNRGMLLQQHFTVGHFDERDIRYRVPVDNPVKYAAVQFAPHGPEAEASSKITNDPNIPEDRQLRGRTLAWQDTEY
jgi:hypothetical protein